MYQVLARKWRPQTLDELVGQPHVARTLRNALADNRLAHAYVFAGVRGTGKTTVARILAKSLNCARGPTATPCNVCVSCTEIIEGRSLDVMELDAASRTGVDNIRELQEVVSYAPVRDRYKVLIIDEAHMLSKAAFNALLKTLEEPPPQVVFILATTEIQRLLPTILSRCQVFEFRRVSVRDVSAHLRRIADTEGIEVSDRTLERVARTGEGSMRDALSVLERVLAFCGSEIADEEALHVLGAVRTEVLVGFVRGMAARDAASLLASLDELVDEGHDLVHFWGELVGVVRDLMLIRAWPQAGDVLSRAPDEIAALAEAAGSLSLEDWTRVFHVLAGLEYGLKASSQPRFLFEGALIRIAGLGAVRPIEEILAALTGSEMPTAPPTPATSRPVAASRPAAPPKPAPPAQKKNETESPAAEARPDSTMDAARSAERSPVATAIAEVRDAITAAVTADRPMLGAVLEQASTIVLDGASLIVGFGPGEDGLRRMVSSDENARTIAALAASALGRPVSLRFVGPSDGSAEPPPAAAGAAYSDDGETRQALSDRVRNDPAVRRLLQEFGAQIVDVRPLRATAESDETASAAEENP